MTTAALCAAIVKMKAPSKINMALKLKTSSKMKRSQQKEMIPKKEVD